MDNKPVSEIERAVLDARLVMAHVLKRAGVPLSTLHRAKDRGVRPLTYLRIMDAIAELQAGKVQ